MRLKEACGPEHSGRHDKNEEVSQNVDATSPKIGPCRFSARVFPYINYACV